MPFSSGSSTGTCKHHTKRATPSEEEQQDMGGSTNCHTYHVHFATWVAGRAGSRRVAAVGAWLTSQQDVNNEACSRRLFTPRPSRCSATLLEVYHHTDAPVVRAILRSHCPPPTRFV